MTERQRRIVERGIRRRLVAAAFGDDDIPVPEAGDRLDAAVVDAVTELAGSRTEDLMSRLVALLDLLELDRRHVPFDAQTRFHDALIAADPSALADPILAGISRRLGFA